MPTANFPLLKRCKIKLFASSQLVPGPRGIAPRCTGNGLAGAFQGLRLSILQSVSSCTKQSDSRPKIISGTHLVNSSMVATPPEPPGGTTSPPPNLQTPELPNASSQDSFNVSQTTVSHVSCLWDSTRQHVFVTMKQRYSFLHPAEKAGMVGV